MRLDEVRAHRAELKALLNLGEALGLNAGLPYSRHWSAAADFLAQLVVHVVRSKPAVIVECGSGLSTLILARVCAWLDRGRVWSLEHDHDCAMHTLGALEQYGLTPHATVLYAPLQRYCLDGESYAWYCLDELPAQAIDLLVVDGPPGRLGPLARYPALPLLSQYLAASCTIILDDAHRPDERVCVARWCAAYPEFVARWMATQRGCVALSRAQDEAL